MTGSKDERHAFDGASLRESRSMKLLIGFLLMLIAAMATTIVAIPDMRIMMGIFAILITPPLAFAIIQLRENSPRGGGRIEIGPEGVFVEGELALPRQTLVRAVVTRDADKHIVSINRRGGFTAILDVQDKARGDEIVQALELGASHALSEFVFDSPIGAMLSRPLFALYLISLAAGVLVPLFYGLAWLSLILGIVGYTILIANMIPAKLTVGLDGLSIRWIGRREIIRYSELQDIDHDDDRLRLSLEGDRKRTLSAKWTGDQFTTPGVVAAGFPSKAAYLDSIVARIREAMDIGHDATGALTSSTLRRGDRDVDAWIRGLRSLLDRGASGFRAAETLPESLWSTVEDGSADPVDRAAAAVALAPQLDDSDRDRLRNVSRVVVMPRLRIALEAAANRDESAVAEALAALEQSQTDERTKRQSKSMD